MDSSLIDSAEDQTFHLIRLPKDLVERSRKEGNSNVGSVFVYHDGQVEFQDNKTHKVYTLMRNTPTKSESSGLKKGNKEPVVANEGADLFKISLQKDEAVHIGKVKSSTLLAVPKVDGKDVSTAFD